MWIGNAGRTRFGYSPRKHELCEIPGGLPIRVWRRPLVGVLEPPFFQFGLDKLVDDKVDDGLRDAEVGRRDALVEAHDAFGVVDVLDALDGCHAAIGPGEEDRIFEDGMNETRVTI